MPPRAIVWDYDGTLVDSRHRNLSVNRSIIQRLTGRSWPEFRALRSIPEYDAAVARCTNWRDFYEREFGIGGDTVESAGRLWTEVQRIDATPVEPFAGVPDTLDALVHVPHAIVSQNAREIIVETLEPLGLGGRFDPIVGYREVAPGRQKPAPDGLLECLARLIPEGPGAAFYVGDHPTDVQCVVEARREISGRRRGLEIFSIAALYGGESPSGWPEAPDYLARRPADIVGIVNGLSSRAGAAGRPGEPGGTTGERGQRRWPSFSSWSSRPRSGRRSAEAAPRTSRRSTGSWTLTTRWSRGPEVFQPTGSAITGSTAPMRSSQSQGSDRGARRWSAR